MIAFMGRISLLLLCSIVLSEQSIPTRPSFDH
jgi:hypothetical protein